MTVKTYNPEEVEVRVGGVLIPNVTDLVVTEAKPRPDFKEGETAGDYLDRCLNFALQPLLEKPMHDGTHAEAKALVTEVIEDLVDRGFMPMRTPRLLIDRTTRELHVQFTEDGAD